MTSFDGYRDATAYSTRSVIRGERPILLVAHYVGGEWAFLDGEVFDDAEGVAVHLAHIVDQHSDLRVVADLPSGWAAERESPHSDWYRYPLPDEST